MTPISEPFGPTYPNLGTRVQKYRRAGTISRAYGLAVLDAINAMNAAALRPATPENRTPNCASGTKHNDGKKILAAVAERHKHQLQAHCDKERRQLAANVELTKYMYQVAMRNKQEWQS